MAAGAAKGFRDFWGFSSDLSLARNRQKSWASGSEKSAAVFMKFSCLIKIPRQNPVHFRLVAGAASGEWLKGL